MQNIKSQEPTVKTCCPSISDSELLNIQKPAQYLGGEHNSVVKDDCTVNAHFALAFPDTYEVGMSHVGIQILYDVINSIPDAWAERVYMPQADMELLLRKKNQPLFSLESKRQLKEFPIIGFSLQYELCATNILTMLDLSGIPRRAKNRGSEDPIIIGGGPYSYHPEAIADFFDVFLLGDAEEAAIEIIDAIRESRNLPISEKRKALLDRLRVIEGVYIPGDFQISYTSSGKVEQIKPLGDKTTITRRLLPSLEGAPFPKKPVIPNIQAVHNRLSIEVMRGCVRGCRFCQAGYLYRPQRERSPQEIVDIVGKSLPQTGFEELSLLSLSTADYCSIVPVLKELVEKYGDGDRLAISFPSTRVDSLKPDVLEQVQRVRRTNFTVAPEAGTQRLRDVINKGVTDDEIIECCTSVFRMGWTGIKLYFMIGLPTETDEDLQGIINLAAKIKKIPDVGNNHKNITVSVSTHVPKPHTPFQWAEQITPEETIRKQRYLADGLRRLGVNFRYHNSFSSFLEGIMCRADRTMSNVIEKAYELGARLDGWDEHVEQEKWTKAFEECAIDPFFYLREREEDEVLPWDHLSCSIPKEYFLKEYRRALRDKSTPDCLTQSCSICGACDYDDRRNVLWPKDETQKIFKQENLNPSNAIIESREPVCRYRVKYRKSGNLRFIGHLEMVRVLHRAMRRAAIPLAYTAGFHPMPKIAFGPPLQLGLSSRVEFFDVFLIEKWDVSFLMKVLNEVLPKELYIEEAVPVRINAKSIDESIDTQSYLIKWHTQPQGVFKSNSLSEVEESIKTTTIHRSAPQHKTRKKKRDKTFIVGNFIGNLNINPIDCATSFDIIHDISTASPRPIEIANAISGLEIGDYSIEKTEIRFKDNRQNLIESVKVA